MPYGPIQLVVVGFGRAEVPDDVVENLRKVRQDGVVRLITASVIAKNAAGQISVKRDTDLSDQEAVQFARIAGALLGYGYAGEAGAALAADIAQLAVEAGEFGLRVEDLVGIAEQIPAGSSAMVLLFEHTWAIGVKQAMRAAGGEVLAQGFVTPALLIALGSAMGDDVETGSTTG